MGPTLTHKRIICHKHIIEGKSVEQTACEAKHSPSAVTRYVKDYKRVLTCWKEGMEEGKIRNATGLPKSLIKEYLNLIKQRGYFCSKTSSGQRDTCFTFCGSAGNIALPIAKKSGAYEALHSKARRWRASLIRIGSRSFAVKNEKSPTGNSDGLI